MADENLQALTVITPQNALTYFAANGLDPIIEKIKAEVDAFKPDITSVAGRKAIASMARRVASAKVQLDDLGKDLTADLKKQTSAVDGERKRMRDLLDSMKEKVRQPLTEWEGYEEKRTAGHNQALSDIDSLLLMVTEPTVADIETRLKTLDTFADRDFQEFTQLSSPKIMEVRKTLTDRLEATKKRDAERAELARLQEEEKQRKQKERDEQLQREAEERAEKRAAEELEREKKAADERLAAERNAAADREKKLKEEKEAADRRAEEAAANERKRIADEQEKERLAAEKREANKKHNAKINNAAADAIYDIMQTAHDDDVVGRDVAIKIVTAIAKGEVPNVKIAY